jgi:pyruvate-formate lyase
MLSKRVEEFKKAYIEGKPSISIKRAEAFTASHKKTEGQAVIIRRAAAFKEVCETIPTTIFADELIVGAIGEFRKSGIICPEYSRRTHTSSRIQRKSGCGARFFLTGVANRWKKPFWRGSIRRRPKFSSIPVSSIMIQSGGAP